MKLLLVEDEEILSDALAQGLKKLGYAVDCAYDGEEALQLYEINTYDLMILDLNLPKIDGLAVLRSIREENSEFRVLILSARSSIEDKINGLDSGSNDYLTKPFDFRELEARIRSMLRNRYQAKDVTLTFGEIELDTAGKQAFLGGEALSLTKKEYGILEYLMYQQERIVSLEDIIEHVWDSETDLFSNSFRVHMSSLRKKLEAVSNGWEYLVTIRGQGYRLRHKGENSL